jgi:hypothetical protein
MVNRPYYFSGTSTRGTARSPTVTRARRFIGRKQPGNSPDPRNPYTCNVDIGLSRVARVGAP